MSQSNNSVFDESVFEIDMVCQVVGMINSRGIWFDENPLNYSLPLLLLQLSLITILTRSIYVFLKPLGQPSIVSHILGGVILGPSVLGRNEAFAKKLFPQEGRAALETLSVFGFMLFMFQVGVKIDPSIVLKSGKRAIAIGVLGVGIPFLLASSIRLVLCLSPSLEDTTCNMLRLVVFMHSITAFPVIALFLAEFKLLNTEIGRIASSSSMISDICFWLYMTVIYFIDIATTKSVLSAMGFFLSVLFFANFLVFGIRPAALWAIRNTPEGEPVKDIYIFVVFVALLGFGFMGQVIGINAFISGFLLGLVIPDGPPLGAALEERLDCFVSALLMPMFFTISGLKTNVFTIQKWENVGVITLVGFVGFSGKIIGTMVPPLFCRMPFQDTLAIGLIMSSKGILELVLLNAWRANSVMTDECFAIMIISVVVLTGVISPLMKALYDPSKRFVAYRRRTLRHHRKNEQLRILACIHTQNNVRAMVNLLEVSNPTRENPLGVFVLHLVKLVGRASALLIHQNPCEKPSEHPTESERIFNVFRKFEQENCSHLVVRCCQSISPYETMHNDVCSLALEHRISFIIIPFHRQSINGERVGSSEACRHLIRNVLDKAPCSVGVLIDRENIRKSRTAFAEPSSYRIAVLFFGGADDREALTCSVRMSDHSRVSVTLFHFTTRSTSKGTEITRGTERSKMLDSEILDEYRLITQQKIHVSYMKEAVVDSQAVLDVMRSMENAYELVIVGKRHGESSLMSSLGKWNEQTDLGRIGEILAAKDSPLLGTSVLVVQQQTRVWGLRDAEESTRLRRVKI